MNRLNRQGGFALMLELTVVVVLMGMLMMTVSRVMAQQREITATEQIGKEQAQVAMAMTNYMAKNAINLKQWLKSIPMPGSYAITVGTRTLTDPLHPTLADLAEGGFLSGLNVAMAGGSYSQLITQTPGGDLEARVERTQPILVPGSTTELDMGKAYRIKTAIERSDQILVNNVGVSSLATPASYTGAGGAWNRPNPSGRAGMILVRTLFNASTWGAFCAQGGDCQVNNLQAVKGNVGDLAGNQLSYTNGQVNTLSGNEATYGNGNFTNGNITNATGSNLNYANGQVASLSGNSVNYQNGQFVTANASNRFVGNLQGNADSASKAGRADWVDCARIENAKSDLCTITGDPGGDAGKKCSNGATNYPTCNIWPPCANGANNPPACDNWTPPEPTARYEVTKRCNNIRRSLGTYVYNDIEFLFQDHGVQLQAECSLFSSPTYYVIGPDARDAVGTCTSSAPNAEIEYRCRQNNTQQ